MSDVIYHLETYDVTTVRAGTPMFLLARKIKVNFLPAPSGHYTLSLHSISPAPHIAFLPSLP